MATGKYAGLASPKYWQARASDLEQKVFKKSEDLNKELAKQYLIAINDILTQIQAFYQKYATENGLSYKDAQIQLNQVELQDYNIRMQQLRQQYKATGNPRLLAEMNKLQTKAKITRLEALLDQLIGRINLLTHEVETQIAEHLKEVYEMGYYQTSYNIQAGLGVTAFVPRLNEEAIKLAIQYPWSGEMFSERIWANRDRLVKELRQVLIQGLIQGTSVPKMTKLLKDRMGVNRSYAERIIRTESNFVLNESTAQGYEANGVEKYEILATLDTKTSKICRKMDGKVFKVSERKQGINYPPFHPNCRTTVVPYFDGISKAAELRRAKVDGKSIIIKNMTYEEWFKRYVK